MELNEATRLLKATQLMLLGKDNQPISDLYYALQMALDLIEESKWISVKERLPEPQKPNGDIYNPRHSDYVLVCIEWWNGQKVIDTACYIFDDEEWEYQGSDESEVIAWRPLPKPYESEAENEADN